MRRTVLPLAILICTLYMGNVPTIGATGSRYQIQYFFMANYFKATDFCRYKGMHLATIRNEQDQRELEKQVTELGLRGFRFWTSGNDLTIKDFQFQWASNGLPFEYTNWAVDEPFKFSEHDHCVSLDRDLKWHDTSCKKEFYFICE